MRRLILLAGLCLFSLAQAALPAPLALIEQYEHSSGPYHDVTIRDADADAYFAGAGKSTLPKGVSQLKLAAKPDTIMGSAHVDFGQLPRPPLLNPLLILFSGQHVVMASAHVDSAQAPAAQLTVTSVSLDGHEIPMSVVDAAIAFFVQPRHPDISRTFHVPLPAHATSATVTDGAVIVHY